MGLHSYSFGKVVDNSVDHEADGAGYADELNCNGGNADDSVQPSSTMPRIPPVDMARKRKSVPPPKSYSPWLHGGGKFASRTRKKFPGGLARCWRLRGGNAIAIGWNWKFHATAECGEQTYRKGASHVPTEATPTEKRRNGKLRFILIHLFSKKTTFSFDTLGRQEACANLRF